MTQIADVSITSDKDYLKIHEDGEITIDAADTPGAISSFPGDGFAATLASSVVIPHSLLTPPLVRAFWDPNKDGVWWQAHAFPSSALGLFPFQEVDPFLNVVSDANNVELIMGTNGSAKSDIPVFYRIYDFGERAVDSDSRIDKIFFKDQAEGEAPAAPDSFDPTYTVISIPHPPDALEAGEVPIWSMQFSENGTDWYGENGKIIGPPDTGSGPPGGPYSIYYYTKAYCFVDDTNFNIILENNYASQKTIHFRYELDYRT